MAKILKIIAGILIVAVIGAVVFINTLDVNQYKGDIVQAVEQSTGRTLQIGGDLQLSLLFSPAIKVEDVKFSNAAWGSKPDMLSVNKLELQVALLPLIKGHIQIKRLILLDPQILLETNKQGVGNWQFSAKQPEKSDTAATEESTTSVSFNKVQIQNARLNYIDGVSGQTTKLVIDQIETETKGFSSALTVAAKASYNDIPLQISGTLGSIDQWLSNQSFPVDLNIKVSDAKLSLKGQIDEPASNQKLNIDIASDIASLSDLSSLAQSELPELGPLKLSGKLTSNKQAYSLQNLVLQLGKSDVSGSITADLAAKHPMIKAKLNAKLLDLAELSGDKEGQASEEQKKERVFSSDPLPLDGLKAVNANVVLNAAQIKTSSMALANTKLTLNLNNGLLTIKPISSTVADGQLNGTITLNASGKTATLATDLTLKGLQPSKIGELDKKISGAKTDIDIKVNGSGNSVSQIMAGLNGKFLVHASEGKIKGTGLNLVGGDLLNKLNPTIKGSDETPLTCAVVNFNVKDGTATADKGIALMTDQMNVVGSGTIDLKTEQLDIGLKPHAREGLGVSVGQLTDFVRLGGTLADPKPTTDVTSALSTGLKVQTAVATGGLSLLAQGLFDRVTADDDPCATALGIKPAATAEKSSGSSTTEKTQESGKDSGGGITDKLKSFFQ